MKSLLQFALLGTLLHSTQILAEDKNDNLNIFLDSIENKISLIHKKINESSKYVDEFITNESNEDIYKHSYIRFENTLEKKESKSLDFEQNLDIRIHLPKLRNKLSITIDNNDTLVDKEYEDSNEKLKHSRNDDYNIGLLYNTIKNDINLKLRLGVKASSNPYLYIKSEAKKEFELSENDSIELEEKLKYSDKFRLDNYSIIHYKHNINEYLDFFNYNEYYINSEIKDNNIYNSLRLSQKLDDKRYLNYLASIDSNDQNSNLKIKEYHTYVSYRKYIRKWLYYDIVPSISWSRNNDFEKELAIKVGFGVLIKN